MAQLRPDMPIHQRTALIAAALARVLDRGPEMSVEATGMASTDLGVFVIKNQWSDERVAHEIDDIARELEVLL
ncbi:hypothetical protein GCM10007291_22400 [Gemmobacter nanjingensis]|uniref:Uncharacterized protein n=1 Tax=Gemmobacter nanjingensis TaxID=488454 RepID=A0ABQ3FG86_9RHOB|nr:hypothetical protein [Gemmobacter nanjingensis]GHC22459.1 hypothetical protein GCM10007291_22400 [Gemmobacter nanjingensis]